MNVTQNTLFVFVTCSLDATRAAVLESVSENIERVCVADRPTMLDDLLVIDNASTIPGTRERLTSCFKHVYAVDRNVGYWSAVDWAIREHANVLHRTYDFVYVIESDMMHYDFHRLATAEAFLLSCPELGAVRCQEFSIAERHLYDKNEPLPHSRHWAWQSHTHRFTGRPIKHWPSGTPRIYETDFLTHLPALNRLDTVRSAFEKLSTLDEFDETKFQRCYFDRYAVNALLDGGIYHCRLSAQESGVVTGSWTPAAALQSAGYRTTRKDSIERPGSYSVQRISH